METAVTSNESAEANRLLLCSLGAALAQCGSRGCPLALLLIELTKFGELVKKEGKDAAGAAVDELLRAIKVHCGRDDDRVFRISSDTIIALCPGTHAGGASHIAARIREAAAFLPSRRGMPVALTIGVAMVDPESGENAMHVLSRAQSTLEAARKNTTSLLSVTGGGSPRRPTPSPFSQFRALFRRKSALSKRRSD